MTNTAQPTTIEQIAAHWGVSQESLESLTDFVTRRLLAIPNGEGLRLMQEHPEEVMEQGIKAWYKAQRRMTEDFLANPQKYMPAIAAELANRKK